MSEAQIIATIGLVILAYMIVVVSYNLHDAVHTRRWLHATGRNGAMEITANRNVREEVMRLMIAGLFMAVAIATLLRPAIDPDLGYWVQKVTLYGLFLIIVILTMKSRWARRDLQTVVDLETTRERRESQ